MYTKYYTIIIFGMKNNRRTEQYLFERVIEEIKLYNDGRYPK